jgi:bifunctional non-homologous end joining protein LigD
MPLDKYLEKRDFSRTPEPSDPHRADIGPLLFVVHKHRATRLHWDVRLELDGVLKSWAVPKGPSMDPRERRLAVMVEDHPFDYRDFEGTVPEDNYGAGPVMIWDRGSYHSRQSVERSVSENILRNGLEKGHLTFILKGERLKGEFALVRLKKGVENNWLLIKKADDFAREDDVLLADTSVVTGRTMDEIKKVGNNRLAVLDLADAPVSEMPSRILPMLATPVTAPFDRDGWIFELKWDGYRCLSFIRKDQVLMTSRNGRTLNERFPLIARSLRALDLDALLDGEIVVTDDAGRADFQLLQNYGKSPTGNLVYYVFDILHLSGHDLSRFPLLKRKEILSHVMRKISPIKISDYIEKDGKALFAAAIENGVEGVVAKDGMSPYRPGARSLEWLKIKTIMQQETVIAGFTAPRGGKKGFGSLVLGVYDDNQELVYVGNCGTGMAEKESESLLDRLLALATPDPPFKSAPRMPVAATWVRPILVSVTKFAEWTSDGFMRHPVFVGLRDDIDPRDVRREKPILNN